MARAADDNGHAAVWFIGHDELLARQFISRLVKLGATELATRLILRYDLQDDQQFRYLFDGADAANGADLDANDDAASSVAYLELQVPPENVVVVSTAEQVQEAAAVLLHPETQLIGLDAEWRPFATGSTFHRCGLFSRSWPILLVADHCCPRVRAAGVACCSLRRSTMHSCST